MKTLKETDQKWKKMHFMRHYDKEKLPEWLK